MISFVFRIITVFTVFIIFREIYRPELRRLNNMLVVDFWLSPEYPPPLSLSRGDLKHRRADRLIVLLFHWKPILYLNKIYWITLFWRFLNLNVIGQGHEY